MSLLLVLSADTWDMEDENTGKRLQGVTVHAVNSYRTDSAESRGYKPLKFSLEISMWDKLKSMTFPAICEPTYDVRPAAQGKAAVTLSDLKLVKAVDLFNLKGEKTS